MYKIKAFFTLCVLQQWKSVCGEKVKCCSCLETHTGIAQSSSSEPFEARKIMLRVALAGYKAPRRYAASYANALQNPPTQTCWESRTFLRVRRSCNRAALKRRQMAKSRFSLKGVVLKCPFPFPVREAASVSFTHMHAHPRYDALMRWPSRVGGVKFVWKVTAFVCELFSSASANFVPFFNWNTDKVNWIRFWGVHIVLICPPLF